MIKQVRGVGGFALTTLQRSFVQTPPNSGSPGGSTDPDPTGVEDPTIGIPSLIQQSGNLVDIEWPITMSASGDPATTMTVDLRTVADPVTNLDTQVINTGIGLGQALTVTNVGISGFDGATAREFRLHVEVA